MSSLKVSRAHTKNCRGLFLASVVGPFSRAKPSIERNRRQRRVRRRHRKEDFPLKKGLDLQGGIASSPLAIAMIQSSIYPPTKTRKRAIDRALKVVRTRIDPVSAYSEACRSRARANISHHRRASGVSTTSRRATDVVQKAAFFLQFQITDKKTGAFEPRDLAPRRAS